MQGKQDKKRNKIENTYRLYIKSSKTNEFMRYGVGPMYYIMELLRDYLVKHDMYDQKEIGFKVERL